MYIIYNFNIKRWTVDGCKNVKNLIENVEILRQAQWYGKHPILVLSLAVNPNPFMFFALVKTSDERRERETERVSDLLAF
jgi:hypothetical protein